MVFIKSGICNGCGECISVCPNSALILQNNHAFIDQELCQECEVCVDYCPQGAILTGEPVPVKKDVIRIPSTAPVEIISVPEQPRQPRLQSAVLPAIGSALLWTGREIVPRLADLAIGYLDRRFQSPKTDLKDRTIQMRTRRSSGQRGKGRRRRQRQRYR